MRHNKPINENNCGISKSSAKSPMQLLLVTSNLPIEVRHGPQYVCKLGFSIISSKNKSFSLSFI